MVFPESGRVDFRNGAMATKILREPSRFLKEIFYFVAPARDPPQVFPHLGIMAHICPNGIPTIQGFRNAVSRPLFFLLKRAKHAVPYNEGARVIFIDVLRVATMVHPMMRRCIEYQLYPSRQLADRFSMDPELVQSVESSHKYKVERLKTKERDRKVERKSPYHLEGTLPQRHREIVFFALMVNDMATPEEVDLMTHPVRPIVSKIHQQDQADPIPPCAVVKRKERELFEQKLIDADAEDLEEQSRKLRRYPATDVGNRVRQAVQLPVRKPFNQQFDANQDEKNRNGKNDWVYVHDVFRLFAPNLNKMTLKLFRAMWFLSVLVVLVNLLYVYAGLPEMVTVQENETIEISREWLFYILMFSIVLINVLVYLLKMMAPDAEDLRSWFHGLIIAINIFFIIAMQALNVYNSAEVFDHSRVSVLLTGSLALILIWAAIWPLYLIVQKFLIKQAV
jgi:hypothetical protein